MLISIASVFYMNYYPYYQKNFPEASYITFLRMRMFTKKFLWSPSGSVFTLVFGWLQIFFLTTHLDGHWFFFAIIQLCIVNIYNAFGWWQKVFYDHSTCELILKLMRITSVSGCTVSYLLAKIALSSSNTPLSFCCSSLSTSAAFWSNCVNT